MVQSKALYTVNLVKNRFFLGGKISSLWKMFVEGNLSGNFVFTGQGWSTTITVSSGKVADLSFQDWQVKTKGMEGFYGFKRSLLSDDSTRFSILVAEKQENA
jgi:hypothetical protein